MDDRKLIVLDGDGRTQHENANSMCEEIKDVIYSYSGKVPLATALGVLEIVKKELIDDHL